MKRAALFGAVMGLVLGGAILAILSLQVSVVQWPADGQAVALPAERATQDGVAGQQAEPALSSDTTAKLSPGPDVRSPPGLADLEQSPAAPASLNLPQTAHDAVEIPQTPDKFAGGTVGSLPKSAMLLATPPPSANAARGFRPVSEATARAIFATPPQGTPVAQRRDHAAARTELSLAPTLRADPNLRSVPVGLAALQRPARPDVMMTAPQAVAERIAGQGPVVPLPAQSFAEAAPRAGWGPNAPTSPTDLVALRADPVRSQGSVRPPMILWLVTDADPEAPVPDWAVATDMRAGRDSASLLPSPGRPEEIAALAAKLDVLDRPGAMVLPGQADWSPARLTALLGVADTPETPVFFPAQTQGRELAEWLKARGMRAMPIYKVLDPSASDAELDATLAAVALRARRDGLVVVQMPADPALLGPVSDWRQGAGVSLGTASLSDLFGG